VALAERFLIHPQEPGWNGFLPQHAPLDGTIHHMPGLIPGNVQQLAGACDRLAGKKHIDDKPLHEHGEPPMWFGPGNLDLDNPVLLAMNPGDAGVDKGLKLAGVQMPPGPSRRMVVATVFPVAFWTTETALEIMFKEYMNRLAFHLKPHIHHFPRRGQTKYLLI
jgi:hypothetical protein